MASSVDIANIALQLVGASRISNLTDPTRSAEEVNNIYPHLMKAELQANTWTFSIRRIQLSSDSTAPAFGRNYAYQLPDDFVKIAPLDPQAKDNPTDYLFEGTQLLTNETGPLNIRYVSSDTAEEKFDPMFVLALAAKIASHIVEPLTQSAGKKNQVDDNYLFHIRKARQLNAIESGPVESEIDEWERTRRI